MCGIGGYFGGGDSEDLLNGLRSDLTHRGPDGSGIWIDPDQNAGMIHTRLAIIGLGPSGAQPMSTADGRYHLVFNGEIYNHRELRRTLTQNGHQFAGGSDTEVLLAMLARHGLGAVKQLAGMFAFALYDSFEKTGFLVRDALGIKPLYYTNRPGRLLFASELRALCRAIPEHREISSEAVRDYLLWGSVPEPSTLVREVFQIPAGCLLKWNCSGSEISSWYKFPQRDSEVIPDPVAFTEKALTESLVRHLESDVPVGVFLSGGIDSTAILALTRKIRGSDAAIETFSIGFEETAFDESETATRTAAHFGTHHHQWQMTEEQGRSEIHDYLQAMDQPTIDGFNTWCVSKLARESGIKVVLSGLGGDELFGGYGSFRRLPALHAAHRWLRPLGWLSRGLPESWMQASRWARLAAFLQGPGGWGRAFHVQRGIFTEQEADRVTSVLCGNVPQPALWNEEEFGDQSPADIVSRLELTGYMRNQLLRDSDVFSMAQGLELRVPFVDVRLVDSLWKIPAPVRQQHFKSLLVRAVPEIPEWVIERPKRGFQFPFQQWLEGSFAEILDEAGKISPVPLKTWYRKWAVAAVLHSIRSLT